MYLVTGGAGFIGSHLAARLAMRGDAVRIFDNFSTGHNANVIAIGGRVEIVRGDLRSEEAVRRAMDGVSVVFHQAADPSVPRSIDDPRTCYDINVLGTLNVLLAARDAGVRRVVFASSCAVYGDSPILPKSEQLAPEPASPYAASKLAGEELCTVFARVWGLETVSLRYFNVYGPRQDPKSAYAPVIPRFLQALLRGERPVIYGDGGQTRDFVYVGDVVQANLLAAEAPGIAGRVFNIAAGRSVSLYQLLLLMADLLGVPPKAEHLPPRPGDVRHSAADIRAARQALGYEPMVRLEEGLQSTIAAAQASILAGVA